MSVGHVDPTFFPGRAATVYYRAPSAVSNIKHKSSLTKVADDLKATLTGSSDDKPIGVLGILHPTVLEKFEIGFPCSALELNLEPFKKEVDPVWINI